MATKNEAIPRAKTITPTHLKIGTVRSLSCSSGGALRTDASPAALCNIQYRDAGWIVHLYPVLPNQVQLLQLRLGCVFALALLTVCGPASRRIAPGAENR